MRIRPANGARVKYEYYDLNRLTSEARSGTNPYCISYNYDDAGNRLIIF
ncbi:MAG: hypothetical protein GF398_15075 [Chitinivibrionales bacterium]|nr:hypothetical protein [Chitinivibrionales bacterium]